MNLVRNFNKIFKDYQIDFLFNLTLICVFLFSQNFLEEDIIIGICSYIILISVFFKFREGISDFFKKVKKDIKIFFKLQNNFLSFFNYLYVYFFDRNLSFVRRTFYRTIVTKSCYIFLFKKLKFVLFKTKFLFIKILFLSMFNYMIFNLK